MGKKSKKARSITPVRNKPVQDKQRDHIRTYKNGKQVRVNPGNKKAPQKSTGKRPPQFKFWGDTKRQPSQRTQKPSSPEQRGIGGKSPEERDFNKAHPNINFKDFEEFAQKLGFKKVGRGMSGYSYPLERGFLVKYLAPIDSLTIGRWNFHVKSLATGKIQLPIPQVDFLDTPNQEVMKMLTKAVEYRIHQGENPTKAVEQLLEWLLWGFGDPATEEAPKIDEKTNEYWYRNIDIGKMMQYPHDYPARLLEHFGSKGGPGWFATPSGISKLTTEINLQERNLKPWHSVYDPAAGTGIMLLHASNYSLNLYAQEISPLMIKALKVNGYLYVPWLVKPFPEKMLEDLKKRHQNE